MNIRIQELSRMYEVGIIDKERYAKLKMELINKMLKEVKEVKEETHIPDEGC